MKIWLYIAGRGHSGSTMLDGMIGNADGVESVGELVSGMGRYEEISGESWDNAVRASVRQAHIRNQPRTSIAGGGGRVGPGIWRYVRSILLMRCAGTERMMCWIHPRKSPTPCFCSPFCSGQQGDSPGQASGPDSGKRVSPAEKRHRI
ncbi:MAG: hypothetical protein K9J79_10570 [Desulfobacteraceae bacterium]|nr:hypothetical protein [Desulfobacteraceae bacterium]